MKNHKEIKLNSIEYNYIKSISDGSYMHTYHNDEINSKVSFNNKRIRAVCQAIILYVDNNYDIHKVANPMNISIRTAYNYIKTYRMDKNFMKKLPVTNVSELQKFTSDIAKDFKTNHIYTYKEAQQRIEEITGLHRGLTQIREFLINNYFKKNSKGYFYQEHSRFISIQLQERNKKIKTKSVFDKIKENEIDITRIVLSTDSEEEAVAKVKEKYNIKEPDNIVLDCIKKNTSAL